MKSVLCAPKIQFLLRLSVIKVHLLNIFCMKLGLKTLILAQVKKNKIQKIFTIAIDTCIQTYL